MKRRNYYVPSEQTIFESNVRKCVQMINEVYHELKKFNSVINRIASTIYNMRKCSDFFSNRAFNALDDVCINMNEYHKSYGIYPISIKFESLYLTVDAVVLPKEDVSDEIIIILNKDKFFDDRYAYRKRYDKIVNILKHEFIHVYHSYRLLDHDILMNRKNISYNYNFDDFDEEAKPYLSRRFLGLFEEFMYYDSKTEKEGRVNGYISFLNNLDTLQIKHIFAKYSKRTNVISLSSQDKINALVVEGNEYNGIAEYRNAVDSILMRNDIDISYNLNITLAYMLHFYNLYHTSPCVNVNYLKNYSNDSEESRKINRDVFAQLFEMIEKSFNDFNYEIFSVTAKFLKDNNL